MQRRGLGVVAFKWGARKERKINQGLYGVIARSSRLGWGNTCGGIDALKAGWRMAGVGGRLESWQSWWQAPKAKPSVLASSQGFPSESPPLCHLYHHDEKALLQLVRQERKVRYTLE